MSKRIDYAITITFWALMLFVILEDITEVILIMIFTICSFILFELADLTDKKINHEKQKLQTPDFYY